MANTIREKTSETQSGNQEFGAGVEWNGEVRGNILRKRYYEAKVANMCRNVHGIVSLAHHNMAVRVVRNDGLGKLIDDSKRDETGMEWQRGDYFQITADPENMVHG